MAVCHGNLRLSELGGRGGSYLNTFEALLTVANNDCNLGYYMWQE